MAETTQTPGGEPQTIAMSASGADVLTLPEGLSVSEAEFAVDGSDLVLTFPDGSKVTMIEDTVTTGGSLLKAINAVEAAGLNVVQVLCVVDRCEGASEIFEAAGYTLEALVTREDIT